MCRTIYTFIVLLVMITGTVACPEQCHCRREGANYVVDCSEQSLTELPDFEDMLVSISIQHISSTIAYR
jgi:hypothetical protein